MHGLKLYGCRSRYAMKILEKLGLAECNPCQVPMEPRLSKVSTYPHVDAFLYRSVIRSLRYLVNTRPDLAYSGGVMSRYMEAPTTAVMTAGRKANIEVCARHYQLWELLCQEKAFGRVLDWV